MSLSASYEHARATASPYLFFIRNFLMFAGEGWRNAPPESPNNTSYYYEESILSFGSLLPTYPI